MEYYNGFVFYLDENNSKEWYVDTKHTNRLKDVSDGVLTKRLENDDSHCDTELERKCDDAEVPAQRGGI